MNQILSVVKSVLEICTNKGKWKEVFGLKPTNQSIEWEGFGKVTFDASSSIERA